MTAGAVRAATMAGCPSPDPDDLLADLDPAQREAVTITSGRCASWPVRAAARPGSSRAGWRTRWPAGVVRPRDVLVVTFTDKAAGEMAGRLAALGHRGVAASTFHAAALRQLRHFWPRVHGADPPAILESKAPILAPLARGLPGRLSLPRGSRPRGGDRMGQGAADRAGRVRDAGRSTRTATRRSRRT